MSGIDLIRAWKDEEYWLSLDAHQRSLLPKNPAGEIEVRDEDLVEIDLTINHTGSMGSVCTPEIYKWQDLTA
jgi:mersacidin/lichenicidin family type 2 lantibiotic